MNQKLVLNRIDKSNVTKLNHPTFNKLASQFIILLCLFALTSSFMYIQFLIHGSKFDVSVASSGKNINEFKFDTKTVGNQSSFKKYSSINVVNIRNFTNILSNKTRQSVIVNIALQSEVKSNITCDNDESCITWRQKLLPKIDCIKTHCGLYFYYHMRKAAGTTITQVLQLNSIRLKTVKLLPAEGLPLDHRFLNQNGIITHVSFRNPVDRIISLYWYEHVLYYHKVQKKPGKASTLRAWVNHWSDSNPWVRYIDISNYTLLI